MKVYTEEVLFLAGRRPGGGFKSTKPVVVRLYPDEVEALKRRVPARSTMSNYIRKIILDHLEKE